MTHHRSRILARLPCDGHGIFENEAFYELKVNGVKLAGRVSRLIERESVDDVHCRQCRVG